MGPTLVGSKKDSESNVLQYIIGLKIICIELAPFGY